MLTTGFSNVLLVIYFEENATKNHKNIGIQLQIFDNYIFHYQLNYFDCTADA